MAEEPLLAADEVPHNPYKGFVAGVFSGIAKQTVGHPSHFCGPLECLMKTVRNEGMRGLYKGATPPLVGWMFMDSIMLGSLSNYRRLLKDTWFKDRDELPHYGHGIAGIFAGWTVSFIAAPVENVKARLQVQYHDLRAGKTAKQAVKYAGPIDCVQKLYKGNGIRGIYHGLLSTAIFRTSFFFWWSSYSLFSSMLKERTKLSDPAINFWAGGLSAQIFWIASYPSDVVKQRVMTAEVGTKWRTKAKEVWKGGRKEIWRGFLPCFLRAFPANACALLAFEAVMRTL